MLTPLLAKVLSLNQKLYRYGPYFRHPIAWNDETLRFESRSKREILSWVFCVRAVGGAFAIGSTYLLLFGLYDPRLNKGLNWLFVAITAVSAAHLVGASLTLYSDRNIGCTYLNRVFYYDFSDEKLEALLRQKGSLLSTAIKEYGLLLTNPRSCDLFGLATFNLVVFYHQIPYAFMLSGIFISIFLDTDVDVVYLTFLKLDWNKNNWAVQWVRFLVVFQFASECFRTHLFHNFASLYVIMSLYKTLQRIYNLAEKKVASSVKEYIKLFVLQQSGDSFQSSGATWLHALGYGSILINGTAVFLGTDLLPPAVYGISTALLIICVLVFLTIYPRVTASYNLSLTLLRKYKMAVLTSQGLSKFDQRVILKRIRAMRPVCFYFGSFRKLDNDAKREFVDSLIDRTAGFLVFVKEK